MNTEWLSTISLRQVVDIVLGIGAVVSVIVEWNKKIPFHPISYVLNGLGKMFNKDLYSKIEEIEEKQMANNKAIIELDKKVEKKFEEKIKDDDEKEAKRLRANIICFSDSCRIHDKHTKKHFENIFRDYDDYMAFCEKHNIPNHYIDEEYEYIKSIYQRCLVENSFL